MHAAVEHVQQQLQRRDADAGMAPRQRVGADQHHGAHGGGVQRIADADRVADDDVVLQLGGLLGRDQPVLERAEAGGDAVGDLAAVQQRLHGVGGALDKLHGRLAELRRQDRPARRTRPRRRPRWRDAHRQSTRLSCLVQFVRALCRNTIFQIVCD